MSVGQIDMSPVYCPHSNNYKGCSDCKRLIISPLPTPQQCPDGTIYGIYSLRLPNGWRVISGRHTVNYGSMLDTETAFTRCYLRSLPKRLQRKKQIDALAFTNPPQYCKPATSTGEAFYVDIKSAYLSIYSRMSWNIEYLRNEYFSNESERIVYPFNPNWRAGRSYVVMGSLPGKRRMVRDGVVITNSARNPYFNPSLVCAVWDTLSAIGRYAVERFQARYYNVDGAIVPASMYDGYCDFLESLGLEYSVKYRGSARVRNLGSWKIGDQHTVRYSSNSLCISRDCISVTMAEADWILDRFTRL